MGRVPTTDAPRPKYEFTWLDDAGVKWAYDDGRAFVIEEECVPENGDYVEKEALLDYMVDGCWMEEGGRTYRNLARKLEAIG